MLKVTEWDCTNEIYLRFSPTLLGILAFGTNVVHSNAIYLRFSTIMMQIWFHSLRVISVLLLNLSTYKYYTTYKYRILKE